ncbi:MAG: dTDP-4-dehydrorhamnose reductase RmlD [Planctomycetota bacterium]|jgi:dTDP-4-dehydrorhamnose reductase
MKILLFGKTGQVGRELLRALPADAEVVAFDRGTADLRRPETAAALVTREAADVVVNAAAYTAVDRAESEPEEARLVNATAVGAIAQAVARTGGWLVHYSTDYVFDGGKGDRYVETDQAGPLSVYGATKLEGERLVAASGCRHLIFRTSWVYAAHGRNFPRTILRLARERDSVDVVDDQIGCPTGAAFLARLTCAAVRRSLDSATAPPSGIYHACPAGATTWHAYARFLVAEAVRRGARLRSTPDAIRPIPTSAYPTPARRPLDARLDTTKLAATFAVSLPPWQDDVLATLDELLAHAP